MTAPRHQLYWFSATGNTRRAAQLLSEECPAAGCPVPELLDVQAGPPPTLEQVLACDLLGVAAPVMAFKPVPPLMTFIERLPALPPGTAGPRAYVLLTAAAWPANSFHTVARALRARGYRVVGGHFVPAEDSWTCSRFPGLIWSRGRPGPAERPAAARFARELGQVLSGARGAAGRSCRWLLTRLPLDLISWSYRPERDRAFWPKLVSRDRCTRCGVCARGCPVGALVQDQDGWPVAADGCVGCFKCFNGCPTDALDTRYTAGRVRYRGPGTTPATYPDQGPLLRKLALLALALVVALGALAAWLGWPWA